MHLWARPWNCGHSTHAHAPDPGFTATPECPCNHQLHCKGGACAQVPLHIPAHQTLVMATVTHTQTHPCSQHPEPEPASEGMPSPTTSPVGTKEPVGPQEPLQMPKPDGSTGEFYPTLKRNEYQPPNSSTNWREGNTSEVILQGQRCPGTKTRQGQDPACHFQVHVQRK